RPLVTVGTRTARECPAGRDLPDGDRRVGGNGSTFRIRLRRTRRTSQTVEAWGELGGTVRCREKAHVDQRSAPEYAHDSFRYVRGGAAKCHRAPSTVRRSR